MLEFEGSSLPVRDEVIEAHHRAWERLAKPGTWWTGEERVAIAAESRAALECAFCAQIETALSPFSVQGEHSTTTSLPPSVIDAIHRVVRDPSRLTKSWVEKLAADGLDDAAYVELVGIIVHVMSMDVTCRGLGAELHALPEPVEGSPSRIRPEPLEDIGAFVPILARARGDNADLWKGGAPHVIRALSLVPDAVRELGNLSEAQYLPEKAIIRPGYAPNRSLDRAQIELVAARVSAVNECFY